MGALVDRKKQLLLELEKRFLLSVLVKGELYSVSVQDERSYRLAQARGTLAAVTGDAVVNAPMPGLIVKIPVEVGQVVDKGQQVIILGSMKMENELRALGAGVISTLQVKEGEAVAKNQLLIELVAD